MAKISVCLATFNEEKNIADCLASVSQLADEIVIVDGRSTDRTMTIAKKYGARVIVQDNPPMFHLNKQKAFEAATGDWILYLDADERVTPKLGEEVLEAIHSTLNAGFWIPRKNIIFGKWIKNNFWYPDHQLRLFRRGKAYLPCKSVHEQPTLTGKAGYLKEPLLHYNYQTVSQYIQKLNNLYTENDKRVFLSQNKKVYWYDAIRFPLQEFLTTFFARESYKDGLHGLVLSLLQSFSALVTFAKLWEENGFPEIKEENMLDKIRQESKKFQKEFRYWFLTAKIKDASNLAEKIWYRILRKTILK